MCLHLRSLFYAAFMRYGQDQSGAASVENAVLWGVLGVLVTSSGWALYNDVADVAQESSDHSERRDSMTTLSKAQKRAKISNPTAPQASSESNDSRIHTSPGNDVAPEPVLSPWDENASIGFSIKRTASFDVSSPDGEAAVIDQRTFYKNDLAAHSLAYKDELHEKCMTSRAATQGYTLRRYTGDDFDDANNSGCVFTRVVMVTNNQGEFIPLYTTTMLGDLDDTSFFGTFLPDQLVQWTSTQRSDCDPAWGAASPSNQALSCRSSFNDPLQNSECYSQNGVFAPSLCDAAPVLNSAGETIMWRTYFESEPLTWREPVDLKDVGTLSTSYTDYNYYLSGDNREDFVPDIPSTDAVDLETSSGEISKLPRAKPGCPNDQDAKRRQFNDYQWLSSCNPTLSMSRLSASLDG